MKCSQILDSEKNQSLFKIGMYDFIASPFFISGTKARANRKIFCFGHEVD